MERLKPLRGIIFGYEINVYLDHNNFVYAATHSEYKQVMRWKIILKEFVPNIQHISGVYSRVDEKISRFLSTTIYQDEPSTTRYLSQENKLFATRVKNPLGVDNPQT